MEIRRGNSPWKTEERKMILWLSNHCSKCLGKKRLITGKMKRGKRNVGIVAIQQKGGSTLEQRKKSESTSAGNGTERSRTRLAESGRGRRGGRWPGNTPEGRGTASSSWRGSGRENGRCASSRRSSGNRRSGSGGPKSGARSARPEGKFLRITER